VAIPCKDLVQTFSEPVADMGRMLKFILYAIYICVSLPGPASRCANFPGEYLHGPKTFIVRRIDVQVGSPYIGWQGETWVGRHKEKIRN
jgi:hypothetical protein